MTTETTTETSSEDTSGLKKNNAELKRERDEWKRKAEAAEREKTEAEENAANANMDEVTRLKSQITKLTGDLEKANGKAADATKFFHSYKAETEIAKLLIAHKVQPDDAPMVSAYIKSMMVLDADGQMTIQDQSPDDFGKAYFSAAGKRYTSAPDNSGGGSTGFDGTKASKWTKAPQTPAEFDEFDALPDAERNAIADKINRPDLRV